MSVLSRGHPRFSTLVLLSLLVCTVAGKKLYCQQQAHGRQHDTSPSTAASIGYLLPKVMHLTSDMCCGRKPFNSESKVCCFGAIISKTTMRCCPDGSFLPKESVCRCHPPSIWVVNQMKKMDQLERKHLHLIEELTTLIKKTKTRLGSLQNEIKLMDEQAQNLYDIFLEMIKIDRTETNEAEHVIEMIKFRNSLEEGEEEEQDAGNPSETPANAPQALDDISLSKMKRDVDVFLHSLGRTPVQRTEIEVIVLKRDQLLRKLSPKYWEANALHRILENEQEISAIATNDRQLMSYFRNIFDDLMTLVLEMETSLKQEYPEYNRAQHRLRHNDAELESLEDTRIGLRRRLVEDPLGWSSDEKGYARARSELLPDKMCDFGAWADYLKSYEARILAIVSDIRTLRRAFDSHRYAGTSEETDTAAQLKRISTRNFLISRYHRRF